MSLEKSYRWNDVKIIDIQDWGFRIQIPDYVDGKEINPIELIKYFRRGPDEPIRKMVEDILGLSCKIEIPNEYTREVDKFILTVKILPIIH